MELAEREWRLVGEESWAGAMNMALDEIAAETAGSGGPRTLRVYQWEPSTLSLGYKQRARTVDWETCDQEDITVTRRPTGGGGIYHDNYGDISYSITAPADELPGDLMECYQLLLEPVFDAFDRMGVEAEITEVEQPALFQPACYLRQLHPAHDVVVGGRKISGNAQYRQKDAVIQHGSLMYAHNTARHLSVFSEPGVSVDNFETRVCSIRELTGISREDAVNALKSALAAWADASRGSWSGDELEAARRLAGEKFESDEWNRRR